MISLKGRPVKIVGGDFNKVILVKRLFEGAEVMEVFKEDLSAEGGYLEIFNEVKIANEGREENDDSLASY